MPSRSVRCRIPCEILEAGPSSHGIAVNLSERGMFVQTGATYPIGTPLRVRILETPDQSEFSFSARVARVKKVHPGAQVVVARGMGLEVIDPGIEWRDLTTRLGCRTADDASPPATGDPTFGLPSFRVVLRRKDGIRIRTRVVVVACLDAQQARIGVEADVEEGWAIVKIERQSLERDHAAGMRHFRVVAVREGGFRRWQTAFDAVDADEARQAAAADLGPDWRIEAVEPAADLDPAAAEPLSASHGGGRTYQVKARHQDGARVRTRVAKVQASSPEVAAARVLDHLGEGWQVVKVTPL